MLKKAILDLINTFETETWKYVDYVDNDKNFVKSDFQPNSDNYYINLMSENSYSVNQKLY